MTYSEKRKQAAMYLHSNPQLDAIYITEDGEGFGQSNAARNHNGSGKGIEKFERKDFTEADITNWEDLQTAAENTPANPALSELKDTTADNKADQKENKGKGKNTPADNKADQKENHQ